MSSFRSWSVACEKLVFCSVKSPSSMPTASSIWSAFTCVPDPRSPVLMVAPSRSSSVSMSASGRVMTWMVSG